MSLITARQAFHCISPEFITSEDDQQTETSANPFEKGGVMNAESLPGFSIDTMHEQDGILLIWSRKQNIIDFLILDEKFCIIVDLFLRRRDSNDC